jgi:hypothetical protein
MRFRWTALTAMLLLLLPSLASAGDDAPSEEPASDGDDSPSPEESEEPSDDSAPPSDPAPPPPAAEQPAPAPVAELPPPPPAPEPPAPPPKPVVGFKKGFFIATPDDKFKLTLGGRIQFRFEYENLDGDPRTDQAAMSLPRMRFKMGGHLFDPRLQFKVQIDFAKGQVSLKDAFIDFEASDWAIITFGQLKTPYSRQFIASSTKQHFVDRAITHKAFAPDRDIGLMLSSDPKAVPLEYAIGLFNGTGDVGRWSGSVLVDPTTGEGDLLSGHASNVPELPDPLVVVRAGVHTPDFDGFDESDIDNSPFGMGVAGGVYLDFDADDDDDGALGASVDFVLKSHGFSAVAALYLAAEQSGAEFNEQTLTSIGGHASVAYAIKGRVEPAFRYARVSAVDATSDTQEILGGVSVFIFKHNIKWVADAGALIHSSPSGSTVDARFRTQLQLDY